MGIFLDIRILKCVLTEGGKKSFDIQAKASVRINNLYIFESLIEP